MLNKKQIYEEIYNKLNEIAKERQVKPYKIAPEYGISQSNYYDLQDYIKEEGDEKRLLSFYKLQEVAEKFDIIIQDVFYVIKRN